EGEGRGCLITATFAFRCGTSVPHSYFGCSTRLPVRSRRPDQPGGMTVVALYSVMMAGPRIAPPPNESRSSTRGLHTLPPKISLRDSLGIFFFFESACLSRNFAEAIQARSRTLTISTAASGWEYP